MNNGQSAFFHERKKEWSRKVETVVRSLGYLSTMVQTENEPQKNKVKRNSKVENVYQKLCCSETGLEIFTSTGDDQ